jgi:hypothetical protein
MGNKVKGYSVNNVFLTIAGDHFNFTSKMIGFVSSGNEGINLRASSGLTMQ